MAAISVVQCHKGIKKTQTVTTTTTTMTTAKEQIKEEITSQVTQIYGRDNQWIWTENDLGHFTEYTTVTAPFVFLVIDTT